MVCTRCKIELTEFAGTEQQPYCKVCWMIVYYDFPLGRLKKIETELAQMKAMGQPQEKLDSLLWAELSRHAETAVKQKLGRMGGLIENVRAKATRQGGNDG